MGLIDNWTDLKVNYEDAQWTGNRRFVEIDNGDGTLSFKDLTKYDNVDEDSTFFGASDANQMNKAMNTIANSVIDLEGTIAEKIEADMMNKLVNKIYPVGSIYMSINSTDPGTLFGGTWVRIRDTFLLASGSSYYAGSSGGSPTSKLIEHTHRFGNESTAEYYNVWGANPSKGSTATGYNKMAKETTSATVRYIPASTTHSDQGGYRWMNSTMSAGSTQEPDDNMPPYLAVYVWKRTA